MHLITKPLDEVVTVLRPESQAEEVERREAEVDEARNEVVVATAPVTVSGAEVVAEETAAEREARDRATLTGEPMRLPLFENFTDLEQKSHLYLLHGVSDEDVATREKRVRDARPSPRRAGRPLRRPRPHRGSGVPVMKDETRVEIRAAISNAYYDARNAGRTMEAAADSATAAVVRIVEGASK